MIKLINQTLQLVVPKQKKRIRFLFVVMIFTGMFEMLSTASILPLIYVVSKPDNIASNSYLRFTYDYFEFSSTDSFILFLGVSAFVLVVISFVFRAYSSYIISKFVHAISSDTTQRLLKIYLSQPYSWFVNRHTAKLSKSLLLDSHYLSSEALLPAFLIISNITISFFLILLLIIANPIGALISIGLVTISYLFIYFIFYAKRRRVGQRKNDAQSSLYKLTQETLGGIKEIKFFNLEIFALLKFRKPLEVQAKMKTTMNTMAELPRYIFQAIAFGGIIGFLLFMKIIQTTNITNVLPLLSLYAFVGLRLIPVIQSIYSLISRLECTAPVLESICSDLTFESKLDDSYVTINSTRKIELHDKIRLEQICFKYPASNHRILDSINFEIIAGNTIAIIGSTGAGKTTLIDVILGLQTPTKGRFFVDDVEINAQNIKQWQATIGYVPQHVFLNDDTFVNNIAFGMPEDEIDINRVKEAAKMACIEDIILKSSSKGYYHVIGEKGVRLSGGERQRIGIARAFYRNPSVLVLDEATNALDYETEDLILENIRNNEIINTVILITHRQNTLKNCDTIYSVKKGNVVEQGVSSKMNYQL